MALPLVQKYGFGHGCCNDRETDSTINSKTFTIQLRYDDIALFLYYGLYLEKITKNNLTFT